MALSTGINVSQMYSQLNNFREVTENIVSNLSETVVNFASVLVENWASPNAMKFANDYNYKLIDVSVEPKKVFDAILQDAAFAAQKMARGNGVSFDAGKYAIQHPYSMYYGYGALSGMQESFGGDYGMDVKAVSTALDDFSSKMKNIVASMIEIPSDISLYDPEGRLKVSFISRIHSAIGTVTDIVNSVESSVRASLLNEKDVVVSSAKSAQSDLS